MERPAAVFAIRRLFVSTLLAGVYLAAVSAAPANARTVAEAGGLRAQVSPDPWQLELSDRRGRNVLTEHPGLGAGPTGTLGFRTASGWSHATQVLASKQMRSGWRGELATTDPARTIRIRIGVEAEGVISLRARLVGPDVERLGIGFEADPAERYLGFGERSNAADQRGNTVENYVSDGPWQAEERPFMQFFIPPWGLRERDDATYFPMPWLLSSAGYGVLVDNTETSYFRLGSDDPGAWSVEVVDAPPGESGAEASAPPRTLRLRFFAGPRPAAVLRRLTREIGRQPDPAAPWMLGAWFHTGQENQPPPEQEREYVERLRSAGAPVSTVETHLRYLPCGEAEGRREAERERVQWLHSQGLATISYLNPEICQDYEERWNEGARRGVFQRDRSGDPYVFDAYVGSRTPPQTPVSQIDFTAAGSQEYWAEIASMPYEDGHDGWMEDFGEYTPLDSVAANGMDGTEMHNLYPVPYHRAGYRFARSQERPVVRHVRSGWTGVHRFAQVVWGGDPTTGWGYDGLRSAVWNGLTMGMSGIGIWGSDIGGFDELGTNELTPELLTRWVQFGAVSGVMRTKKAGVSIPPKGERPQVWDPDQIDNWRRYTELRTQLYPYITGAAAQYRRRGMPLMRHLALAFPRDRRAAAQDDEFLFGSHLLAAPVLEPDARERALYLPRGRWIDFWRSVSYRERGSGAFSLSSAKVLSGGRDYTLPAPLDELPLAIRAGAVLPLLPANVDTLADYGRKSLTKLRERDDRLRLLALPRGRSVSRYYERGRIVSRETKQAWKLELRGHPIRKLTLEAALDTMKASFRPCALSARSTRPGRKGPRRSKPDWDYSRRIRVLRVRLPAWTSKLTVKRC